MPQALTNESRGRAGNARLRKRSVVIAGHRTSVSLETAFWDALKAIAKERRLSLNALVGEIDASRTGNLSSALRLHVLDALKTRG
jgi:predicted DNA-binding ribbon-helix-helix protein